MMTRFTTDFEVEAWFDRNRDDVAEAAAGELDAIAAWIPLIGLPANDRAMSYNLRVVPAHSPTL